MSNDRPVESQDQDTPPPRAPIPTGSTRFRNTDYAEQREHWPDEDDRR
jgi:hypothetical protein